MGARPWTGVLGSGGSVQGTHGLPSYGLDTRLVSMSADFDAFLRNVFFLGFPSPAGKAECPQAKAE